jgi:hypothetical protein
LSGSPPQEFALYGDAGAALLAFLLYMHGQMVWATNVAVFQGAYILLLLASTIFTIRDIARKK